MSASLLAHSTRQLHLSDLLQLLPWVPGHQVCDIGAGRGELAFRLAEYGFSVTALDVDKSAVDTARQRFAHLESLSFLHQDIRGFRMQRESYGLILCLNVFPFIPNGERARIIGRLKAALKPGGIFICSGLQQKDAWASEKKARTSNQISARPTGTFGADEWQKRFHDWNTLWAFEGRVKVRNLDMEAPHDMTQRILQKPFGSLPKAVKSAQKRLGVRPALDMPRAVFEATDFLELSSATVRNVQQDHFLLRLQQDTPLHVYTEEISLADDETDPALISDLKRLLQRISGQRLKLKLGFYGHQQGFLQALLPTEEALEHVKTRIRRLKKELLCHLTLEHLPFFVSPPAWDITEPVFLKHVAEEADCTLGLSLQAIYTNATAFGMSPTEYLSHFPEDRVVSLHLDLSTEQWQQKHIHQLIQEIFARFDLSELTYGSHISQATYQQFMLPLGQQLKALP